MIQNDDHDLAMQEFDELRRDALARVYEIILALPIKDAHRHADNMNDGQRGNECKTRCVDIVHQKVVSGEEPSNNNE